MFHSILGGVSAAESASHGDETPVRNMLQSWLFGIMLPASAIVWHLSNGSLLFSIAAAFAIPILAIFQGAVGILGYRFYFGDAPLPLSPSHGVVIVNEYSKQQPASEITDAAAVDTTPDRDQPVRLKKTQSFPLSLGCQCGLHHSRSIACGGANPTAAATPLIRTSSFGHNFDDAALSETDSPMSNTLRTSSSLDLDPDFDTSQRHRPLRLLVIGDSLAIGVGQARQCTPVMPEVMAKTLSARLGGRVVYWTCHGAPGASTGWIVRELERGVTYLQQPAPPGPCRTKSNASSHGCIQESSDEVDDTTTHCGRSNATDAVAEIQSVCSDTDESSSDESIPSSIPTLQASSSFAASQQQQRAIWRERLAQHRKRFDPEALGPYDIVVVMTGSNDLKSAFFPFLLTGEDAEFRRQAKARGGSYTKELRRLLETLNRGMRSGLQNIRHSVEAATETVIEIVSSSSSPMAGAASSASAAATASGQMSPRNSSFREKLVAKKEWASSKSLIGKVSEPTEVESTNADEGANDHPLATSSTSLAQHEQIKQFPLVVLPGLPSRALPIFRKAPLRWLSVPIVDIMDMHKRKLAKSHPGEVLFVPPPSIDDLSHYETGVGELWRQRCQEDTVLTLRDIRRMDCRRIEADLREYYDTKDKRIWTGEGLRKQTPPSRWTKRLLPCLSPQPAPGTSIFSIDEIHPTDDGYDFWGRYIANSIADEWLVANPGS